MTKGRKILTDVVNKAIANGWHDKALAATQGTQFGAIIRCRRNVERDATPRFVGNASVTSDGFVMCDFVDRNGNGHMGAFVGSFGDLTGNVSGLSDHLALSVVEREEFRKIIVAWVGTDWRTVQKGKRS